MINHARTLLLNAAAADDYSLGDEYIPPAFTPLTLPTYLRKFHAVLFGATPDRLMRNYRAQQLMSLLHSTSDLADFVTGLDSRITYNPTATTFFSSVFGNSSLAAPGTSGQLTVVGSAEPPDTSGVCEQAWRVLVVDADTVRVSTLTGQVDTADIEFTTTSGLSSQVPLIGSTLNVLFTPTPGNSWKVVARTRPARDISQLESLLRSSGEERITRLFGVTSGVAGAEPMKTFFNAWSAHPEFPYRLGCFLLAYIYRVHEALYGELPQT